MTQQCKYDDQLLDYLYGELDEPARKLFAEHLQSCSACAAQVESLGRVRKEYQNRPPIEPAGEAMQRMTALLMQAAASAHAPAAGGAEAAQEGGKVLQFRSRGLRRILFHPAGGVMAVAAAALFWVVFRAQPGDHTGTSGPTSFRTMEDVATETAAATATPAAPAVVPAQPAAPVDKSAPAGAVEHAIDGIDELKETQGRKGLNEDGLSQDGKISRGDALGKDKAAAVKADKDDDFGGLRAKSRPAKEPNVLGVEKLNEEKPKALAKPVVAAQAEPTKPLGPYNATPAAKPSAGLALELRTPAVGAPAASKGGAVSSTGTGAGALVAKNAPTAPRALDERVYAKAEKKAAGDDAERWAQPPPPPPPAVYASPSPAPQAAAPAPVQAPASTPPASSAPESQRDEDNSVSSAIARTRDQRQQKVVEALANQELGSLGAGGNAGAPSPAQSGDSRYVQRHAGAPKTDSAAASSRGLAQESAEAEGAPAATAPGRAIVVGGNRDEGASALAAVKDQLRRGQCAEANTALIKLERTQPTLHGLAELRAEWQSACAAPNVPQLERRVPNEALEAPAPASASRSVNKLRSASPAPPPKAAVRAKAASKPAPERSKAADAAVQ